ncbi:MAG TPA: hypothetical protein VL984_02840 [Acidimicrobiales bacterium]|nr:hypothetical protein [Acidimicrobiales bacterium]
MAISEQHRYHLHQKLEQVLGAEEATTLMEHLPPVGWSEMATKHDIGDLRASIGELSAATKHDIGDLRASIGELRLATKENLEDLERSLDGRFKQQEDRLSARLERELRLMTWRFVTVVIAALSVVLAVARL